MPEAKTVEVSVEKLMTPKNKVYFPGKAVLSEKEAETFKVVSESAAQAEPGSPATEVEPAATKKKK